MKRIAFVLAALAVALPALAAAEIYTLTLDNGATFETRYRPKLSYPDGDKAILLTSTGNWISFPVERVAGVEVDLEVRGYGLVIDTTTISLGFAPNESATAEETATDPSTRLLQYLQQRDGQQGNATVDQFVNTDRAGQAGFPSSFGIGASSRPAPGFAAGVAVGQPSRPAATGPPGEQ